MCHYPPRPPSPPIKAEWTPREPLALYCPSSMTPMWPEERNIVLILPDTGSGRSLPCVHLKVVFCFSLLLFAVDFLAKYCIFSQEKVAEYRRAFEEVSGTWESLEFMLMILFIDTYLEVKLAFFLTKNKKMMNLSGLEWTRLLII